MAHPHHDGDDAQFTATFDDEALKTDLKLLWAERENIDLKLKLHGVQSEARGLKAKVRELEAAANSARASTVPDGVDFLQKHHELQKALKEKEQDAHYTRTRMQALEADNETLTNELDVMKLKLDESEARCNDGPDNQALIEDNNALRSRVEMLAMKYDEATAQHYASMDTFQNMTDATRFLRTKNVNNESEIQVLRVNIAPAEFDRDWHRSEHTKMLEIRNNLNAATSREPQIAKLKAEVANPKRDIAYYVTHLDLAAEDLRVYTCPHDGLRDISNDQSSTREKTAGILANDMYHDWKDDAPFMRAYNSERHHVLKHHRVHERDKPQGRGAWPSVLKKKLINVDIRRGASITYS